MVDLLPLTESVARRAIEKILETIPDQGVQLPPNVLIDDGRREWHRHAALLPVEVRRRSVIAAFSDAALLDAAGFELGGATLLPVSTPALKAACEIAASNDRLVCAPIATLGALEVMLRDAKELWVVGWRPQWFWHRQVGPTRLSGFLTDIASRLRCAPVLLPGPVLLIADRERAEIVAGCRDQHDAGASGCPVAPTVWDATEVLQESDSGARVEGVLSGKIEDGRGEDERTVSAFPVLDLSTGRPVGCWSPSAGIAETSSGFTAFPPDGRTQIGIWDFMDENGSRHVLVETTSLLDQERSSQTVIRVPGFIGAELRPGSPAGLLVERLAHDERRVGRPLWVPSVDNLAVRFLLRLPGPIWVDGPGVPG